MTDSTMVLLGMASLALAVILYVWFALALAAMFQKMGEPAWKAWVPVVNVATILQRGDFSPWLVLLNVVPLFGAIAFAVVFIVAVHRITVAFDRGAGLTVVGALVPVAWASVLGWGTAHWSGDQADERSEERLGPFRRGNDHVPTSVPLVGGWTPDAASAGDASRPALSGWMPDAPGTADAAGPALRAWSPHDRGTAGAPSAALDAGTPLSPRDSDASGPALRAWSPLAPGAAEVRTSARDGWTPDRAGGIDASNPESREEEPVSTSESVLTPFAAPSVSLTDAVPAAAEWAPSADSDPVSVPERRRSDDDSSGGRANPVPEGSVSDVLDALRDDFRPASGVPRRGHSVDALQALSGPRDEDGPDASPESHVSPWVSPTSRRTQRAGAEPAPVADVPLTRPSPETAPISRPAVLAPEEEFPELSEAVSAVSEVPEAGSPRSARTSVSSLYTQSEVPALSGDDDLDALDRTVVTRRKRIPWMLVPPSGKPIALTSDVVILGRRPGPDAAHPDAQLVSITDETRTVSKTHARLNLRGDTWFVTDLDSTNGVLFATLMGTDVEAPRGEEIEAGARFFLGDAEVRLARSDA